MLDNLQHWIGTGKEGNLCEIFYYLVDFFHGLMDMGVVDFMNKNKKKICQSIKLCRLKNKEKSL